jgi:hypothetical protein
MIDFFQWVEEQKLELPTLTDSDDTSGKPKLGENVKRSGIGHQYPDAYVRAQYPHKYFNSQAPDADYKLSAKPRKDGPDTAAN